MSSERRIHQVKANISDSELRRIEWVRQHYGFRSNYEFVRCAVSVLSAILCRGGLHNTEDIPSDLRALLADTLIQEYQAMQALERQGCHDLFEEESNPNRAYAERFARSHYQRLHLVYRDFVEIPRLDDGFSRVDIFEDMMLRMLTDRGEYVSYEAFEAYYLGKFSSLRETGRIEYSSDIWQTLDGYTEDEYTASTEDESEDESEGY